MSSNNGEAAYYSIPGNRYSTLVEALHGLRELCYDLGCGANIKCDDGSVCAGYINDVGMFVTEWFELPVTDSGPLPDWNREEQPGPEAA